MIFTILKTKTRLITMKSYESFLLILASEASTATFITDNLNEDQNFLITPAFAERHREHQATNLNRLKDKNVGN